MLRCYAKFSPNLALVTTVILPDTAALAALQGQGRLLGIDYGSKRIGLALSDATWKIASPLTTLKRVKFSQLSARLFELIDEHKIAGLVLGLPLNMDGSEGPRVQATRQFAANLLALRELAVFLWDERLSTAAVQRMLVSEMDTTRQRRGEVVDKLAATYILQNTLDAMGDALEAAKADAGNEI